MKTKSCHYLAAPVAAFLSLAMPFAGHSQARYPGSFGVVDIIPNNQSGETANNGEPSIGVGSGPSSGQIVAHSFAGFRYAPQAYFSSSDFGFHWSFLQTTYDNDATVDWNSGGATWGPTAYTAMLLGLVGPISVWRSEAPAGGALLGGPSVPFSPLAVLPGAWDQPWLREVTVNDVDHIYVCATDHGPGPRAGKNWFSLDGGHTWHGPITLDPLAGASSDVPSPRLDFSPDGKTVYAVFTRLTSSGEDIVLVRDDNSGLDSFRDLPGNGTIVAQNIIPPSSIAGQRLAGEALVACMPTHPERVWVAYATVNASGQPIIQVHYSVDGGRSFPFYVYTTDPSLVDAAGLPAMAVSEDGTMGLLYVAKKGNNMQVRIFKAGSASFHGNNPLSPTSDQILAAFPVTQAILSQNPWVGDYFQLKTVGNDFYGIFSAMNDPQPSHFPSGVYFQRNVGVNGTIMKSFWLNGPGVLVDNNGSYPVTPSMDPFFFYSVGGTLMKIDPNMVHLKTFPTKYPPVKFVEGPVPVPPEGYTDLTNNPPFLNANGEFMLPYDSTRSVRFFRAKQEVTNAIFQIFASVDGNGTLSPSGDSNGIVYVPGMANQTFTATASNNYAIGNWHLDGSVVQTGGSTLTISNVIADHSLMVTFPASNDLAVTVYPLSADPENPPFVGSNLTYVAEVMNAGLNPLTDVIFSNLFDPTVTYISATASQGSVAYAGGSLTGNLGGLAPGAEATVTILVQPQGCGTVTNIVSTVCDQFEPNLMNNTAMDVSIIWGGDLGIISQPQSQVVDAGATVNFSVYVDGCPPVYSYQWNFNGVPIFGATDSTLTLTNVTGAAAGQYDVTVLQTAGGPEDYQKVESDPATLTVIAGPAAPTVVTEAAGPVNYTGAGLNGTILPNGLDTTYWYQWGLTASYGQTTPSGVITADNTSPAYRQVGITGLAYGTTYHCQLYGSNIDGIASGGDQTFTTPIPPPMAIVATFAPTNITSTSALLQGIVNGEGSTWLGFFQWGTTTSYGNNTPNFYYPGTSGPGATYPESAAISGLSPNTTYHVRIVAFNGNPNEALGNDVTFSTSGSVSQSPPTVTTLAASAVNAGGATLNGSVNPNGANTTIFFEWGTTTSYGNITTQTGPYTTPQSDFQATLTGLAPNTTYHFRVDANNSGGISYGTDLTFTTGAAAQAPPTVQTLAAFLQAQAPILTSTEALLNGSVNPNGAGSTVWFEWGTTTGYGATTTMVTNQTTPQSLVQAFISGLLPSTTYHCRIDASNSGGTSHGNDVTFTTSAGQTPPGVQTLAANGITSSSADLNGSVNPSGASSTVWFEWGTSTSYGNITTQTGIGTTPQSDFQAVLAGLSPNTTYHYRVDAVNSGGTSHGNDVTFTTKPLPPSVITQPASNNGGNGTLTLNASVTPNGGLTYTAFQYGKTTSFELGTTPTPSVNVGSGTSAQPVTTSVTINPQVYYYFRAVASNPGGQTYGATLSIYGGGPQ